MSETDLQARIRRALTRGRRLNPHHHDTDLEAAVRRAFGLDPEPADKPATTSTSTVTTSLAHQDHALAERLGATIHNPTH